MSDRPQPEQPPGEDDIAFVAVAAGSHHDNWTADRQRASDTAFKRGLNGYAVPIRRNGQVVGHRHVMNNLLLLAACYGVPMTPPRAPWDDER